MCVQEKKKMKRWSCRSPGYWESLDAHVQELNPVLFLFFKVCEFEWENSTKWMISLGEVETLNIMRKVSELRIKILPHSVLWASCVMSMLVSRLTPDSCQGLFNGIINSVFDPSMCLLYLSGGASILIGGGALFGKSWPGSSDFQSRLREALLLWKTMSGNTGCKAGIVSMEVPKIISSYAHTSLKRATNFEMESEGKTG